MSIEVNIESLSSSVNIEDYAEDILGLRTESHSRNLKRLVEHDSCIIYPDTNSYYRYSTQRGGNIYEFIMEFEDCDFKTALQKVKDYFYEYEPELKNPQEIKADKEKDKILSLPEKSITNDNVIKYLNKERGLSESLINTMIEDKRIYQDTKNNVVFLGYEKYLPGYASRRSTYSDFKGDVSGSRKEVGFFINNNSDTLIISESPIDSLSILDMQDTKTNHLGIGGVGTSISSFKYFVENNETAKNTNNIIIAFDNDEAGITASERLKEYIEEFYIGYNVQLTYPKNKDFNQDLVEFKKNKQLEEAKLPPYQEGEIMETDKTIVFKNEPAYLEGKSLWYQFEQEHILYFLGIEEGNLNIVGYKVDTSDENHSLDRGAILSHEERKILLDILDDEISIKDTLTDSLVNTVNHNALDSTLPIITRVDVKNSEELDLTQHVRYQFGNTGIFVDFENEELSGDSVRHGDWVDTLPEENIELLNVVIENELFVDLKNHTRERSAEKHKAILEKEKLSLNKENDLNYNEIPFVSFKNASGIDLQATLFPTLEQVQFEANGKPFLKGEFNDFNIGGNIIHDIIFNPSSNALVEKHDELFEEINSEFDKLAVMSINSIPVAYQSEQFAWFDSEVFELNDRDLVNHYLEIMNNNRSQYSFNDETIESYLEEQYDDFYLYDKRTNDKILYHGSNNHFDRFNLDFSGKNGLAQGIGIYTSDNIELADMYVPDSGYLYTLNTTLENELKMNEVTIPTNQVKDILQYIHAREDILSNFGEIEYMGYKNVLQEALDSIMEEDNDVDIYNSIASLSGNKELTATAFYDIGQYTHILATEQTRLKDNAYIILNPEKINIMDITKKEPLSRKLSDDEYLSIINFNLLPEQKLLFDDNQVTLVQENGSKIVEDNLENLYENAGFKQALLADFELLGLTELQHSSLFKENPSLFAKIIELDDSYTRAFAEATKEVDLDNDGIPDRIDIDDTRNSVQTVADLDTDQEEEPKHSQGMKI